MTKTPIKDLTVEELSSLLVSMGEPKFKGKQIFKWVHSGVISFDEMTNISKDLRAKLKECCQLEMGEIQLVQKSAKDGTRKYLIGFKDGSKIESVFMKYNHGNSICLSSQAGCKMGCTFCASGKEGLIRNLSPGEIIDQIHLVEKETGEKISNVVVMGTGEPFDNYENLIKFIEIVNNKDGLNIGKRRITVSTCGLIPRINDFAKDMPQVNLAISLHNPRNEKRTQIMPINRKYPVDELISTAKDYAKETQRRVTYEYALILGENDDEETIELLIKKLKNSLCHVNLIPLNIIEEETMKASSTKRAHEIKNKLESVGIETTVRRELGSDIDAACGQLRLQK